MTGFVSHQLLRVPCISATVRVVAVKFNLRQPKTEFMLYLSAKSLQQPADPFSNQSIGLNCQPTGDRREAVLAEVSR
jgi:hypothetical protein